MKIAILTTDNREHFKDYDNPRPFFGTAPEALLQGFADRKDVQVHVISCVRRPMASPEKIADNIWYHGLVVPKYGWISTGYQGCIRTVRRKLKELKPDIVHGQGTERDCAITAVFSGFPNVLTLHGNMRLIAKVNEAMPFSYQWLNARLEAFTIPRSLGVICITRYTREAVSGLAKRTWLLPNAVDKRYFDAARTPVTPPVILCVGLICRRKNQNNFIRALDGLAARQKFTLVFLGGAPKSDPYAGEFLRLVNARPWCRYIGMVSRDELKRYLSEAMLLALLSIEDNCPMTVLEAMAAGLPVVGASAGGIPELVQEGVTGLLCDPLSARSMAAAVETLILDPARALKMGRAGREEAQKRFLPSAIAERHMDIYREVLRKESA